MEKEASGIISAKYSGQKTTRIVKSEYLSRNTMEKTKIPAIYESPNSLTFSPALVAITLFAANPGNGIWFQQR